MKSFKSIIIAVFSVLFLGLTSCGGGTKKQNTHTHEDGSVHDDHAADPAKPAQETFKVEADTTAAKKDSLNQKHDDHGQAHDHGDGKPHKH